MSNPSGSDFEKERCQPKQNHLIKSHFKSLHAMMNYSEPGSNCVFCCKGNKSDTDHSSENCPLSVQERRAAIKLSNRCYLCFKLSHIAMICRKKYLACRCKNRFLYHKLLCDTSFPHSEPLKEGDSTDRSSNQIKHSARVNSEGQIPTEVSSALNKKYGDSTFLQTFAAEINNKRARGILDT
ncbi:hypothetical protein AVEN_80737-1 [Araneus ventricosus]|uniref:Uncharacterized protein n=1 Tax=Araneus ventricosus TaxID=182803 RepID=A0A4Y2C6E1_ARAVE|nr:hypothetical protein AVEN_80737-1 [Araneus ventricosus]